MVLGSLLVLVDAVAVCADHFTIDLEVKAGKAKKLVHAERLEPGQKPKTRAVFEVPVAKEIRVQWTLSCTAPQGTFKDVIVHFFVVQEDKIGQPTTPKLNKEVAAESALTMDFTPGEKAKGEMKLEIARPGAYLLRLETIGAGKGNQSHEHFAALDLLVK
jgi:hypothetical protein